MATLPPGQAVTLPHGVAGNLAWPPPDGAALHCAIHPDVLKAGDPNLLTLGTGISGADVVWVGTLETMLSPANTAPRDRPGFDRGVRVHREAGLERGASALADLGRGSCWALSTPVNSRQRP